MLMKGKKGIVTGVANKHSIAWAICQALRSEGAKLCLTYQGEKFKHKVRDIAHEIGVNFTLEMDVNNDHHLDHVHDTVKARFKKIDFLVHSIAFADREDLIGEFKNTSRAGFLKALEISSYSLTALARTFAPLMTDGGSIVTMTYLGSLKVVPKYNVMGVAKATLESSVRYLASDFGPQNIRVNAVSAGPINTLAARGIPGFTEILKITPERAAMKRNVEPGEVANAALFLCSQMSSGITGEVMFVDCGYNIMGM